MPIPGGPGPPMPGTGKDWNASGNAMIAAPNREATAMRMVMRMAGRRMAARKRSGSE